jgi:integrase
MSEIPGITVVEEQLPLCQDWLQGEPNAMSAARARLKDLRSTPHAPRTIEAYDSDWAGFVKWGAENNYTVLPADPETLCLYLSHEMPGHSVNTLLRRVAAIRSKHLDAGYPAPTTHRVRNLLSTMRKKSKRKLNRKAPISLPELARVSAQLAGENTFRSIRDRAILLLGFAGAFRRSELAGFDLEDIDLRPDRLAITLGRSKTDQIAKGRELIIPRANNPKLCPIIALNAWLEQRGKWEGPLFTDCIGKKVVRMTRNRMGGEIVWYAMRSAARRAGIENYNKFGAHSLRAGFVTTAADAGADVFDIMATTGHKSLETLNLYVRRSQSHYALRKVL